MMPNQAGQHGLAQTQPDTHIQSMYYTLNIIYQIEFILFYFKNFFLDWYHFVKALSFSTVRLVINQDSSLAMQERGPTMAKNSQILQAERSKIC